GERRAGDEADRRERGAGEATRVPAAASLGEARESVRAELGIDTAVRIRAARAEVRGLDARGRTIERADADAELHVAQDPLMRRGIRRADRERAQARARASDGHGAESVV